MTQTPSKSRNRFIDTLVETAAQSHDATLPWARGRDRAAMIAKRLEDDQERLSA